MGNHQHRRAADAGADSFALFRSLRPSSSQAAAPAAPPCLGATTDYRDPAM